MKDDTGEKRGRGPTPRFLPRIALLACIALVVISLGVALLPASPKQAADPPFSEQARAAALSETLRLRAAGEQLGSSAPGAGQPVLAETVSLLTAQVRALLSPGQPDQTGPSATAPAGQPFQSGQPPTGFATSQPAQPPGSPAGLATALAASGSQRLADAAAADGGMARLLAAVGTAQLLQAGSVAAATGAPLPPQADPLPPQLTGACPVPGTPVPGASVASVASPSGSGSPSGSEVPPSGSVASTSTAGGEPGNGVTVAQALEAAVRTERQSIYGYQLALTRLRGDTAKAAAGQLARHEALLSGAESLSLRHCVSPPPPEAGYGLAPSFLAAPGAGLAGLESGALPVYGDLVALSSGETRQWAISALLGTARGAALWGAAPGPLPGLTVDVDSLPPLPSPDTPAPSTPAGTSGG